MPLLNKLTIRISIWASLIPIGLIAWMNQQTLLLCGGYVRYQMDKALGEDRSVITGDIARMLSMSQELGYTCLDKKIYGSNLHQQITHIIDSKYEKPELPKITNCVALPTGKIIFNMTVSNARYYIFIQMDTSKSTGYYIIDIRGETLG